ncbi:hypothetical protein [Pseudomonas sp. UMAB-08]|uniref:hypothetical protein n=1 Tax=Pseudomonas sp. UMAB-08 TaxID=1365375 RepID=UPI001C59ED3E|nr:hypothetical protein [Pseudomonas sp. UMAB-08]
MKRQNQDDFTPHDDFSADYNDAPPGLRRKKNLTTSTLYRNVFALLALFTVVIYLLTHRPDFSLPLTARSTGVQAPMTQPPRPPGDIASVTPTIQTINAPARAPQALADCIKPGNVIDASVVTCRYGEFPPPSQKQHAQGMVSAEYLAQYEADKTNRQNRPRGNVDQGVNQAWVRQWDGRGSYLAQWTTYGNRIDGSSVCGNHRSGSIDYRECRKGAKVYFKEECRAWGKRWESGRADLSKAMEERYCSAANGFSPMG